MKSCRITGRNVLFSMSALKNTSPHPDPLPQGPQGEGDIFTIDL